MAISSLIIPTAFAFLLLGATHQLLAAAQGFSDSRPVITCYRCIPSEANRYCANEFVDDNQVDCLPGRCIVMSANFKNRPADVVRLYDCDSTNIVDSAFQLFVDKVSDRLSPNTCKLVDFDNSQVLDNLRDHGMSAAVTALSRNDSTKVQQAELCSCENSLCNNAQALDKITQLRRVPSEQSPYVPPESQNACACGGMAWYWIVLIVLGLVFLATLLASLAVWLYKRSRRGYNQGANPGGRR